MSNAVDENRSPRLAPAERFEFWKRSDLGGGRYEVVIGEPVYVKNDSGKYVPYICEMKDDHVAVKSGLIGFEVHKDGNQIRAELYDPYIQEKRATEIISFIDHHGDPLDLEYADTFIDRGNMDETLHCQQKKAVLYVKQVYRVLGKLGEEAKKEGKKMTYIAVTYAQGEGAALSHSIEARNFSDFSDKSKREDRFDWIKEIRFDWTFPTGAPIFQVELDDVGKPTITKQFGSGDISVKEIDNVRIKTKDNKLWLNEMTKFNREKLKQVLINKSKLQIVYQGFEESSLLQNADTYTTDDPVEDGYIIDQDDTRYSVPPDTDIWLNTTAPIKRGFIEWPLGGDPPPIPPLANVTYIKMEFETAETYNSLCEYKGLMAARPSGQTGTAIWNGINNGTRYALTGNSANTGNPPNTWRYVVLGANESAAACYQLEGKLGDPDKWFAVGMKFYNEAAGKNVKMKAEEYGVNASPKPKLTVVFTP